VEGAGRSSPGGSGGGTRAEGNGCGTTASGGSSRRRGGDTGNAGDERFIGRLADADNGLPCLRCCCCCVVVVVVVVVVSWCVVDNTSVVMYQEREARLLSCERSGLGDRERGGVGGKRGDAALLPLSLIDLVRVPRYKKDDC
jgi:hypothetical protein